jgi:hypothetical protein
MRRKALNGALSLITTETASLVISIALLLIATYVTDVKFSNLGATVVFVTVVAIVAGAGSYAATRIAVENMGKAEREFFDRLFHNAATAPSRASPNDEPFALVEQEVISTLEKTAREIWAYAFDLRWDAEEQEFSKVIRENLAAGKAYHYLVPRNKAVLTRVKEIVYQNRDIPDLETRLQFRERKHEIPFATYGITIYNPSYMNANEDWPPALAVWFPHFGQMSDRFLKISGSYVTDFQREFADIWNDADAIDVGEILANFET